MGAIIGTTIVLLSLFNLIKIWEGIFLVINSVPLFIYIKLSYILPRVNDIFNSALCIIIFIFYFAFLGFVVGSFYKSKNKIKWFLLMILIVCLHILFIFPIINYKQNFKEAIEFLVKRLFVGG